MKRYRVPSSESGDEDKMMLSEDDRTITALTELQTSLIEEASEFKHSNSASINKTRKGTNYPVAPIYLKQVKNVKSYEPWSSRKIKKKIPFPVVAYVGVSKAYSAQLKTGAHSELAIRMGNINKWINDTFILTEDEELTKYFKNLFLEHGQFDLISFEYPSTTEEELRVILEELGITLLNERKGKSSKSSEALYLILFSFPALTKEKSLDITVQMRVIPRSPVLKMNYYDVVSGLSEERACYFDGKWSSYTINRTPRENVLLEECHTKLDNLIEILGVPILCSDGLQREPSATLALLNQAREKLEEEIKSEGFLPPTSPKRKKKKRKKLPKKKIKKVQEELEEKSE